MVSLHGSLDSLEVIHRVVSQGELRTMSQNLVQVEMDSSSRVSMTMEFVSVSVQVQEPVDSKYGLVVRVSSICVVRIISVCDSDQYVLLFLEMRILDSDMNHSSQLRQGIRIVHLDTRHSDRVLRGSITQHSEKKLCTMMEMVHGIQHSDIRRFVLPRVVTIMSP